MATSTAPTLIANLLAALQARAGLSGVLVTWGMPQSGASTANDWVNLGTAIRGSQAWAALNRSTHPREEEYYVDNVVSVVRAFGENQLAAERALALMAEVEGELRGDITVGGAVRTAELAAWTMQMIYGEVGDRCEARLTFEVLGRERI